MLSSACGVVHAYIRLGNNPDVACCVLHLLHKGDDPKVVIRICFAPVVCLSETNFYPALAAALCTQHCHPLVGVDAELVRRLADECESVEQRGESGDI